MFRSNNLIHLARVVGVRRFAAVVDPYLQTSGAAAESALEASTAQVGSTTSGRRKSQPEKRIDDKDITCEVAVNGYVLPQVEFYANFVSRAAKALGANVVGPKNIRPNVRRWTVLTSPFKYKKHQETFQRKSYKRLIKIAELSPDGVDKYTQYVSEMAPAGIGLRVIRFEHQSADVSENMQRIANKILEEGGHVDLPNHVLPNGMTTLDYIRRNVERKKKQ